MEEKYQKFSDFAWSDERWQAYLAGLYPQPAYKQVLKFKKKWYKKNVDAEFDETYEPGASSCAAGSCGSSCGAGASVAVDDDGRQWAAMGAKGTVCFAAYAAGIGLSAAALAGLCDTVLPLALLTGGFVWELLAKHPPRLNREFLQAVAQEEVGSLPFMALVLLMPGFHKAFRVLALVPFGLAALVSLAMLCRHSKGLPGFLTKPVAPLAEVSARYQLMRARADAEVMLGFAMVAGAIARLTSPLSPLLYWNVMTMRYAVSPWTQASFRKVDGLLAPVLGRIPGVSGLYSKLKDALHGFAVPSGNGGSRCTIL